MNNIIVPNSYKEIDYDVILNNIIANKTSTIQIKYKNLHDLLTNIGDNIDTIYATLFLINEMLNNNSMNVYARDFNTVIG